MGAYINPASETKGSWLSREGKEIPLQEIKKHEDFSNILPVILVDNGMFTAAAIGYSKGELDYFLRAKNERPKRYFLVEIKKLHQVSSDLANYLKSEK